MADVKPLEELCFSQIVTTLEKYSISDMVLLPKAFRERLLLTIPVVDVCRLEGTQFTADIDMESIWKNLYKEYITYPIPSELNCRDHFFTKLLRMILKDGRPYGYFKTAIATCHGPDVRVCCEDFSVTSLGHPVDSVNYLLATKLDAQTTGENALPRHKHHRRHRLITDCMMTRHEVTQVKGVVPPGKTYQQACQAKQCIPPRYMKFFPEGSCYLPDSTALRLICEKCQFRPKKLWITITTVNAILLHEGNNIGIDALKDFLTDVEMVTFKYSDLKINTEHSEAPGTIISFEMLQALLDHSDPKLASLTIETHQITNAILESIAPIITASQYSGLKELNFHAHHTGSDLFDLAKLISIAEQQTSLEMVSFLLTGRSVKHHIHINWSLLLTFFQICFQKPSLRHLKLRIDPLTTDFLIHIVVAFLSTPCSHEQTLTCWKTWAYASPLPCSERPESKIGPRLTCKLHQFPPPSLQCSSDTISTKKSIEFRSCSLENSSLIVVACQVVLKALVFNGNHKALGNSTFLIHLANEPLFDMETLEIQEVDMHQITIEHMQALLMKKSLQSLKLINCTYMKHEDVCQAAAEQGFDLIYKLKDKDKRTYTITRLVHNTKGSCPNYN